MPFFNLKDQPDREIAPGVTISTCSGHMVMLSYVRFLYDGAEVPMHTHPHEQLGMGLEGEFELIIGDESHVIKPGIAYTIPSGAPHSARSVNGPALTLDIFHPVRDEYK